MSNETGTVWVTFNGEIYNHAIYRDDLQARGHTFRSRSDTEAIIHLYEEHGPEVVAKLDGMFAFGLGREGAAAAVWDRWAKPLLPHRQRAPAVRLRDQGPAGPLGTPRDLDDGPTRTWPSAPSCRRTACSRASASCRPGTGWVCDKDGNITRLLVATGRAALAPPPPRTRPCAVCATAWRRPYKKRLMADVPMGAFLSGGGSARTSR
jgi:asparagine synthase (glutamine-hydrolysing)